MSKTSFAPATATRISKRTLPFRLLRALALVTASLFLTLGAVQAADTDEEYLKIFNLIEQGDTLHKTGDPAKALGKYREAEVALKNFRHDNPGWNPKLVNYRWNDLASKIAVVQDAAPATGTKPAAGPAATPSTAATKPSVAGGGSQVKLLGAGAEPRKLLRLSPKVGDKQTMGMTMQMGMEMKMGEMEMPAMKIPAINMSMTVTIKEVSPQGDITFDTDMGEATLTGDSDSPPEVADAMKASLDNVKGMSGSGKMSNRGITLAADMKSPANANAQFRQAMEQMKDSMERMSSPLPEEAVGIGAKWETKTPVKSQGMTINQTATYELVALEGDKATIKSTITQSAANQKISNPSMPGMKVEVSKMSSNGGGSATWDFSKILPVDGNVDLKSEIAMKVPTGGDQQDMTMKMDISLKMEAK